MSFILNALKKAEQERLRNEPKDLEDFASARWDPYEQTPSSNKTLLVLVVISLSILSLVLVIYSGELKLTAEKAQGFFVNQNTVEVAEPPIQVELKNEPDPYALPELIISGHMFFEQGSKSNRLFANDQSFKEGEIIDNGWRLTTIGMDGIEMAKQNRTVFIAYP
jgi:hypothetical protein